MYKNTCLLYHGITEVYEKLRIYCFNKGFKVKKSSEKYYFIMARKRSIFIWKNLRLQLKIVAVEKRAEVTIKIYKLGLRQRKLENEYCIENENLFKS